jgi:hypothetical protein
VLCCKHLLLGVLFFLSLACTGPAFSQGTSSKPQPLDSNTVLLEIRIDGNVLTDSLSAFQFGEKVFLPLGEMSGLLTVGIRSYPGEGTARGFIRGEDRPFSLHVANSMVTLGSKSVSFDPAGVLRQEDDIYVESKLLAEWLLVDFKVDLSSLSIQLRPREPLPLQQRLEREAKIGGLPGSTRPVDPNYPVRANPYRLLDLPFIDQTISLGKQRSNDNNSSTASYSTYIRGDFAGLQASAFLSGTNQRGSADSRLTVGRYDPGAGLLGPLAARSFWIGNVSVAGVPNISPSADTGNGFSVSNLPLDRPTRFTSHTLQGNLPPGWDVELYLNKALIGYQQSKADGKYSFNDLSLVYGENEFRLVFHGPQGQLRVERQDFLLDDSLNDPGRFYYNVASSKDVTGLQRTAALAEWGLSKYVTGRGGIISARSGDGTQTHYTTVGLNAFAGNAIVLGNLTRQTNGGSLYELGLRTRLAGVSVGWNHLDFHSFTSELFPASIDPLRRRDQLRFDGVFPIPTPGGLPFTFDIKRDRWQSGANALEADAVLSASIGWASISNSLHLTRNRETKTLDGIFQVAGNVEAFRVRGQASYTLQPHAKLSSLAVTADRSLGAGYLLNVGANHSLADSKLTLTSSLTKSFGNFGVSLTGGFASRREFNIGLQLFMAIGHDPRRSQWILDAVPMAESGGVSARVFIDANGNGVMDGDETPVSNVGFLVNSSNHPARTDSSGIAYIGHLPANRNTDIAVNTATVEDPQLASMLKGLRIVPRPGNITQLDFPLATTGEIDGTVALVSNGGKRGIGNVLMELVDTSQKVVAQARSGSDGFFVLVEVLPGQYSLRVGEQQLNDLQLRYAGARTVTVPPKGAFINGQDFVLERRPD